MILSEKIINKLDSQAVRHINEIYHNIENSYYDTRHDEILGLEQIFWQRMAKQYITPENTVTCLDYGTGTGFVPTEMGPYLEEKDTLICCDVSSEMLTVCKNKLAEKSLSCKCHFHLIEGDRIPVDSDSVDIITVNSVLHHLFDLKRFASECARTLRSKGVLIVSHEPHKPVSIPAMCRFVRSLAEVSVAPKKTLFRVVEKLPFMEGILRAMLGKISQGYQRRNSMLADIARQIRHDGILDVDLTGMEIQQIVDFQSQHGFDRQELTEEIFHRFIPAEFETYCHLGFFTKNKLGLGIDRFLRQHWPDTGREMRFVLERS
jgi:ubiquinone/menaquinone biosynthesis C-methylase UbiE